jgi:predicted dehydrogenase
MGRWHGDAAVHAGGAIVGVCDIELGIAEKLARRFGSAAEADFSRLLEDLAPDVVHICTPLASHRGLAQQALEERRHVIVEKPLTASPEETHALLTLALERGVTLCPVHQLIFQRWLSLLSRVGDLLEIEYSTCSAGALGRVGSDIDRVVDEILPHALSLFERIAPGSLEDARWVATRPALGELRAHTTAKGVSLALFISMRGRPPRHELRVTGTDGTLRADLFHGFAWLEGNHPSRIYKVGRPFFSAARQAGAAARNLVRRAWTREFAYPGLRELVAAVYSELRGAAGPALEPEHTRRVARARRGILSEAGSGPDR